MLLQPISATFTLLLGDVAPYMEEKEEPNKGDSPIPAADRADFRIKSRLFMAYYLYFYH